MYLFAPRALLVTFAVICAYAQISGFQLLKNTPVSKDQASLQIKACVSLNKPHLLDHAGVQQNTTLPSCAVFLFLCIFPKMRKLANQSVSITALSYNPFGYDRLHHSATELAK